VSGWYGGGVRSPDLGGAAGPDDWITCSGALAGLKWVPGKAYLPSTPPPPLNVALGRTAPEALSVMLADWLNKPELEELLLAVQFGLLSKAGTQFDADEKFRDAVHQSGFAQSQSGRSWAIQSRSQSAGESKPPPLPKAASRLLAELNAAQTAWDEAVEMLASLRKRLFADWYKFQLMLYDSVNVPNAVMDKAQAVATMLQATVDDITEVEARREAADVTLTTVRAALEKALKAPELAPHYALTDLADQRHWQPEEPVLMVMGDAARPSAPPAAARWPAALGRARRRGHPRQGRAHLPTAAASRARGGPIQAGWRADW